jgi:hypothetical protein
MLRRVRVLLVAIAQHFLWLPLIVVDFEVGQKIVK